MAKKKFGKNVNYYNAQRVITEKNKAMKIARHNKDNPNDITKKKNPQLSKEVIESRRLNKLIEEEKLDKAVAVSKDV